MTPVIYKVQGVGYIVASATTEGAWWMVEDGVCSCPAYTLNCRHVRAVQALVREENERFARPVYPPNISALVD